VYVCVRVCVYVCVRACMRVCLCVLACVRVCMCVYSFMLWPPTSECSMSIDTCIGIDMIHSYITIDPHVRVCVSFTLQCVEVSCSMSQYVAPSLCLFLGCLLVYNPDSQV